LFGFSSFIDVLSLFWTVCNDESMTKGRSATVVESMKGYGSATISEWMRKSRSVTVSASATKKG
jgi:hypothetical protein